jgi:microsomal dipeptidase-like Zn-dependent dipeptidase
LMSSTGSIVTRNPGWRVPMKKTVRLFLIVLFFLASQSAPAGEEDFGKKALATIHKIASVDFQGRKTGTPGGVKIENYLAREFERIGLLPWKGSYLQKFTFFGYNLLPGCALDLLTEGGPRLSFAYNKDFYYYPGSANGDITAEVVFAGYGLHEPGQGYDDYHGIDVKDKIVLAMEGLPPGDPAKYGAKASWPGTKAKVAQIMGAVALLLYSDPGQLAYFPPYKVWGIRQEDLLEDFIVAGIHGTLLDRILEGSGEFAVDLKRRIDRSGRPSSFKTGKTLGLKCRASIQEKCEGANVLGIIPGTDPVLKDEFVSIGGHIDSGGTDPDGAIFFGAEDDASGTSVVLEIAERLATESFKPLRTILFAGWGAEEQGGWGSRYFVDHPIFPLDKNAFNFCVDNVGWGDGEFFLFSANNFPEEFAIVKEAVDRDLMKSFVPRGLGGSDSYIFQARGIPALFAHTTQSQSYNHRPMDTPELINPLALKNVTKFMYQALKGVASYRGALINPDRYSLFLHRYSAVADSREDLIDLGSESPEKAFEAAAAKYQLLRVNGIDLCGQDVPSSTFKETVLKIRSFEDSLKKVAPSIAVLEKASQLQEIEEGGGFLVALRIFGLRSFDADLACLEVLHRLGVRILCLDLSSSGSPEFRTLFNGRSELSAWGRLLLKKSEDFGLVLELLDPGQEALDRILAVKAKPVLITTSHDHVGLARKAVRPALREKVYLRIPLDAGSADISGELHNTLTGLHDIEATRFSVLDPFSYTSAGQLKTLTVALARDRYTETAIQGILGENLIRLFSADLKD